MEQLCRIRDIYRSIIEFEAYFEKQHHLCLNEGMLLCSLSKKEPLSSGEIAEVLGLTNSNTSKVIKAVESKNLVRRVLGEKDKRQMYFSLTDKGRERLQSIKCSEVMLPELLQSIL